VASLRALTRSRPRLALWLIALALAVKALVPAGYMIAADKPLTLTLTVCSAQMGETMTVTLPMKAGHSDKAMASDGGCAFSSLGHATAPGTDPLLLVAAIAFVLALGTAPRLLPALARRIYLQPPLRGPPALA
jgi:hypothetical protein